MFGYPNSKIGVDVVYCYWNYVQNGSGSCFDPRSQPIGEHKITVIGVTTRYYQWTSEASAEELCTVVIY